MFKILCESIIDKNIPVTQDVELIDAYRYLSLGGFDDPHISDNGRLVEELKTLWNNPTVQQVYKDRRKLIAHFPSEGLDHFMNNIDKIKHANYVTSEKDWLYSTTYTMRTDVEQIRVSNTELKIVTVGGRRMFRRGKKRSVF
jgi:hypothetical protein